MLDAALSSGLSSDRFWNMTFRELAGHYKSKKQRLLDDWDQSVWMTHLMLKPHLGKDTPGFYELHPLRDASEANKDNEFQSQEDIDAFLKSFNTDG